MKATVYLCISGMAILNDAGGGALRHVIDALVDAARELTKPNAYYAFCSEHPLEPITLTGLCLHMGLSGRQALFNYATYEGFLDAVTRARTLIEYSYEKAVLMNKNAAAGRLLGCMDPFWNPTLKVETDGQMMTHEDRLSHLR